MPVELRLPGARAAAAARAQADPVRRRRGGLGHQGLGQRRRPVGAVLPGRLRGRAAQPGRPDPLRGAERARGRARRAHLHRVARPRGAHARAWRAPVHRGRAPAGQRLRRARLQLRDRDGLYKPPHRARPGGDPSFFFRTDPGSPSGHRRGPRGVQPRTRRRLPGRGGPRRRRTGGARDHRPDSRLEARRAARRPGRTAGSGSRRSPTCLASTTYRISPTAGYRTYRRTVKAFRPQFRNIR